MLVEPVELPLEVLTTALRWDNRGEPHPTLSGAAVWRDEDGAREIDERAWTVLGEQGLVKAGGLRKEFRSAVAVLGRPEVECYGLITAPNGDWGVLAAASGNEAVLAVRDCTADRVQVSSIRAGDLAEELIARLPDVPGGWGRSFNVPEADFLGTRHRTAGEESWVGLAGRSAQDAHPDVARLREVLSYPRTGSGQLYAAGRDEMGRRYRVARPVTYVDTVNGRWLLQVSRSVAKERWIVVAPASPRQVLNELHEVQRSL
ncbi:ESX secretion-associated protein EspG [Solihabitans fulvus]|nr:ESX secretion-associated protein EspG [Solihabitans fulvus]